MFSIFGEAWEVCRNTVNFITNYQRTSNFIYELYSFFSVHVAEMRNTEQHLQKITLSPSKNFQLPNADIIARPHHHLIFVALDQKYQTCFIYPAPVWRTNYSHPMAIFLQDKPLLWRTQSLGTTGVRYLQVPLYSKRQILWLMATLHMQQSKYKVESNTRFDSQW